MSKEYLHMQKLAGLFTEEEYRAQMWYKQYSENLNQNIKDFKSLLLKKGYDIK
jgi:hypothetical protein